MRPGFRSISATLLAGFFVLVLPHSSFSQELGDAQIVAPITVIPEAPLPHIELAAADPSPQQPSAAQSQGHAQQDSTPSPPQAPSGQSTSSSQTSAPRPADANSQQVTAEEQLKQQEKQRVMGVMPSFNTTTNRNALPLSSKQKFQLFFKSSTDPWPFFLAGVVSGIGQADDSYPEWGQGAQGYGKRFGAAYTDTFIGNFFGNAVLPSVLHEDPRYFQKGSGSFISRSLWAASSTVWCRRDNGRWGPNYANVGGNLIGSAIARAYYPASQRNVGDTITNGITVSLEGIVGAEVIEFWPDIARHFKRKHDEKLARQAAQIQK